MFEVTIPLRQLKGNELTSTPEEYYRVIQEEYASRFLAVLGIAATAANKAAVLRHKPLDDCEVSAVWAEGESRSAVAEAIRISPPLGTQAHAEEVGPEHIHSTGEQLCVQPPTVKTFGVLYDDIGVSKGAGAGGAGVRPLSARDAGAEATDLASELELIRHRLGGGGRDIGQRSGAKANGGLDSESRAIFRQELSTLKQKFILPFACQRRTDDGRTLLVPWDSQGPLDLDIPRQFLEEAKSPLEVSLEEVRKSCSGWVNGKMPLEMLIGRRSAEELEYVRGVLNDVKVAKLIGLLSHLFYWLTIGVGRGVGEARMTDAGLHAIYAGVYELWVELSRPHREATLGVNVVLPCLLLTLKQGIEASLEAQYPSLLADEVINGKIVERINSMCLRLFDPDGQHARFGKGDASGKAIQLTKQLDMLVSQGGATLPAHKIGRMHRCSPLVRSLLAAEGDAAASAPRTRAILHRSGQEFSDRGVVLLPKKTPRTPRATAPSAQQPSSPPPPPSSGPRPQPPSAAAAAAAGGAASEQVPSGAAPQSRRVSAGGAIRGGGVVHRALARTAMAPQKAKLKAGALSASLPAAGGGYHASSNVASSVLPSLSARGG